MVLLLATLLSAAPVGARPASTALAARLDMGGLLGASWYVPAGRAQLSAAMNDALRADRSLEFNSVVLSMPVLGPWMLAGRDVGDAQDRALLVTSGVLQLVGLSVGAFRLANDEVAVETGPVLSFSPIASGRLGFSVRLTGF